MKQITVYTYDEWAARDLEVAGRIIERYRGINVDDTDWDREILAGWEVMLTHMGLRAVDIRYSGFYSQGDGASFSATDWDMGTLVNQAKSLAEIDLRNSTSSIPPTSLKELRDLLALKLPPALTALGKMVDISVVRGTSHYVHERTCWLEFTDRHEGPSSRRPRSDPRKSLLDDARVQMDELRIRLCKMIYHDLESAYNSLLLNTSVIDTLRVNEYHFDALGRITPTDG